MVTAEIIAAVYYKALANATSSKLLNQICHRILNDEDTHINFQSYALNRIQHNRNPLLNFYMRINHFFLMLGTLPVVWFCHHKVYKAAGYNFYTFIKETLLVYNRCRLITAASEKRLLQQEQLW